MKLYITGTQAEGEDVGEAYDIETIKIYLNKPDIPEYDYYTFEIEDGNDYYTLENTYLRNNYNYNENMSIVIVQSKKNN